ncbi:MAG: hypothetical protein DMG37_15470 [Acidobacteria bacterium]|nr:MAG: hypothetical protein DMG37_15470 [Acidobacteriota bacterium]
MRLPRIIAIISFAGFSGLLLEAANQAPSLQKEVTYTEITYTKDIAPILNKNCVVCHRPNDVAHDL